ncbi:MAG: HlyD family secretion protein [Candidatus Tectimicrobiota bacterium]
MHDPVTSTSGLRSHAWRRWILWGAALLGCSAVGMWLLLARLPVYRLVSSSQLAFDTALQFFVAPVAGSVRVAHLQLGQTVQTGDVLVQLDDTEQRLQVDEERQHLMGLQARYKARQQEESALEESRRAATQEGQAALQEAQARQHEAIMALQGAQEKTQRLGPFAPLTALSPQQGAVETARVALQRLEREQRLRAAEWQLRLAQFQREVVALEGDMALATARLTRLEQAQALRQLRAPVAGRLGAVAPLPAGAVVQPGERLGVIVLAETPLVTATLDPVLSGRPVQAGQHAWLRSTEGGLGASQTLPARVWRTETTGQEARQRVVLRLAAAALDHWPLRPDVRWTAVIEVERVNPLTLALRTLGQYLWDTWPASSGPGVLPAEEP